MYKIYQTRVAPNARRLRLFLAEKGVDNVEYITVNILEGANLSEEFRRMNPFARVPVLEFEDGTHLSESVAISRYFEEIVPEPALFGVDALDKATVEMWNRRVEINFMLPAALAYRNISGTFKDREHCDPAFGETMKKPAAKSLALLNQRLGESRFLAGERYSIADITLTAAFDFFSAVKVALPPDALDTSPNLKRWHDEIKARPNYGA